VRTANLKEGIAMKTVNQLIGLLVIAAATGAQTQAAKPAPGVKLTNETPIFKLDDSRKINANRGMHTMRLSPDGKMLLYVRRVKAANKETRGGYQLALRDIKTGKDTIMPGAPCGSDDFFVACVSMLPFDAKGEKLVIPIGAGAEPVRPGRGTMQLGLYDIKSGKVNKLDLSGPIIFPTYDAEDKNLIVLVMAKGERGPDPANSKIVVSPADKIKFRKIGLMGLPRSPCPGSSVLPILLAPARDAGQEARRGVFVLYDTKSDKQLAAPPASRSKLDDYNPQWTADGRYLYYVDTEKDAGPNGCVKRKSILRIWDRRKNAEHAIIEGMIPVGPGPGKSAMILSDGRGLHYMTDPTSQKTASLGDNIVRLISAGGGFIVYIKHDKNGDNQVFRAKIKLPGATKK
jgi:hypothetical protein